MLDPEPECITYGSGSARAKSCDSAIPAPGGKGDNLDHGIKNSSPYD